MVNRQLPRCAILWRARARRRFRRSFCVWSVSKRKILTVCALPGAQALLATLNELQIPWAIVTSGSVPVAHARHKAAGLPAPAVFITAENVKRGKPEPDAYLLGAEKLGLAAGECVVVEDAPAGVLAGLNAGSAVIAVNAPADTPRLSEVTFSLTTLEALGVTGDGKGGFTLSRQA